MHTSPTLVFHFLPSVGKWATTDLPPAAAIMEMASLIGMGRNAILRRANVAE